MANEGVSKNTALIAIGGAAVLAVVIMVAFYFGKHSQQAQPLAQGARPGYARVTRLPPQRFGNWVLQCVRGPQGGVRCELGMNVIDASRRRLIMRLGIVRTQKGDAIVALTPPNALLPAGFSITPDKGERVTVPFTRCLPRACQTVFLLSDALAANLKASQFAQIHFVAGSGRPVNFKIPVQGFDQGLSAWKAKEPQAPVAAPSSTTKFSKPAVPATAPGTVDSTGAGQPQN